MRTPRHPALDPRWVADHAVHVTHVTEDGQPPFDLVRVDSGDTVIVTWGAPPAPTIVNVAVHVHDGPVHAARPWTRRRWARRYHPEQYTCPVTTA